MTVPDIVRERLGGEEARARVPLGGDDELVVTPTRTLVYRAEGLLSGESVDEYSHRAEAVSVDEGRRKATVRLDHGYDGESAFTVPPNRADDVLRPVIGGVLAAGDVTDPDEVVDHLYRLGELTLIITGARVIKHVGSAVWDEECEQYDFERVTGLDIEQGSVSSQIIVEVDGRPQRIKAPTDEAVPIRDHIERALLAYHDVRSYVEFRAAVAPDDEGDAEPAADAPPAGEPNGESAAAELRADGTTSMEFPAKDAVEIEAHDGSTADRPDDVGAEVTALRAAVERQNELLEAHQRTIEQLIDELRRGR